MTESLLVKIDVAQLQQNLTAAGDPVTEAETVEFLLESGSLFCAKVIDFPLAKS